MKSYKFYSLDGVGIDLICDVFIKMLSNEMDRVRYFNYNNYEWRVGVNVVQRINELNGRHPLPIETGPNSILGIQVMKSYTVNPNEIVLCISPRLSQIDESKKDKVLIGDLTSGYRYFDTDEAERIKAIENAEKEKHKKSLDRLKNMINASYGITGLKNMVNVSYEITEESGFNKDTLDALRYAIEAAKFLNFGIGEKEGDIMPTKYNQMFKGNLYFGFRAEIKDVIFNNPATIILWKDGTKTVVKCGEGEAYDPEKGMAMAIAKRLLGNQGNYYDTFKKWLPKEEKKEKVKTDTITPTTVKPGRYATVKELSKKVGVSESTIRGQIRKGQFPGAIKQDGVWLIPVSW